MIVSRAADALPRRRQFRRGSWPLRIADVTHEAGYFDQPHLTRSLRRLIGQTPLELRTGFDELSLLYKTEPFGTP